MFGNSFVQHIDRSGLHILRPVCGWYCINILHHVLESARHAYITHLLAQNQIYTRFIMLRFCFIPPTTHLATLVLTWFDLPKRSPCHSPQHPRRSEFDHWPELPQEYEMSSGDN